jgi:hypothetical protein
MAKQSGLGDNFYIDGYDLSGDVSTVDTIAGPQTLLDNTAIRQAAFSRMAGLRDGQISFTSFFNPSAVNPIGEHTPLKTLPLTDRQVMYFRGTTLGGPGACLIAKQINYDPTRGTDGSLTMKVDTQGNQFGLEWGNVLTPGIRTDGGATAASSANSYDTLASAAFGGQAYLQVFSVTGTSVTASIWDSADNITFAAVASFGFSAVTPGGAPTAQRISITNVSTIRRYVAVATAGTFSNAQFAVVLHKNEIAGIVF